LQKKNNPLNIKPFHLALLGITLIALLFFFAKTKGPNKPITEEGHTAKASTNAAHISTIDYNKFIAEAKKNISADKVKMIDSFEHQLANTNTTAVSNKILITQQLIAAWKAAGSKIITAQYAKQLANLTQQPKDYAQAGDYLVTAFETAADSTLSIQLGNEAFEVLQKAIETDSTNIDNKVNMAACLMESRHQIMDGVPILLEIVKKSPNHLKANFILAKFAVVSGQYDKAIIRLERLIANNPSYTDAYLVLANAYSSKGDVQKAKITLQQCQQHTTDARIKTELNKLIKQFN
jgi:tetratricopeptide (TPR) repeat protein